MLTIAGRDHSSRREPAQAEGRLASSNHKLDCYDSNTVIITSTLITVTDDTLTVTVGDHDLASRDL